MIKCRSRHDSNLPFRERTYDCQNLAFLLGVSLRPIISKCCLNILAAVCFLCLSRSLKESSREQWGWGFALIVDTISSRCGKKDGSSKINIPFSSTSASSRAKAFLPSFRHQSDRTVFYLSRGILFLDTFQLIPADDLLVVVQVCVPLDSQLLLRRVNISRKFSVSTLIRITKIESQWTANEDVQWMVWLF